MTYDGCLSGHYWNGGGICSVCGERLRCVCGAFVTERGFDAHVESCRWLMALPPVPVQSPEVPT